MAKQSRGSGYRPFLLLLALFLALGIAALVLPGSSRPRRVANVLWGVIPAAVALWEFAYSRLERHRLRANRIWMQLTNPECTWGLTAEFAVDNVTAALKMANELLHSRPTATRSLISSDPALAVWQVDGLTARFAIDVSDDPLVSGPQGLLRVEFLPAPRAFRTWRRLLGSTVFQIVEKVDSSLRPTERKFSASVAFPRGNPYFGLFVANLAPTDVKRFEIDYFERATTSRDLVQVRADQVRFVTDSANAARELSLHYLALQPVGEVQ
jgi:hypothetical protein